MIGTRGPTGVALALALALAGCVEIADDGGPWEAADAVSGPLAPELGEVPAFRSAPGCVLRIASWNLHKLPDPRAIAANLRAARELSRADVLLIQESSAYEGEARSRTGQLAGELAMTWAHQPVRALDDGGVQGNAILSRYPLERIAVRRLPYIDQPYHPQPRGAIAADVVLGDVRVRVVSVHLDVRLGIADRVRQLDPAVRELDERAVIGGDFNTAPWAWAEALVPLTSTEAVIGMDQAALLDDYMKARRFASGLPADSNTFQAPGFAMRLDNLYARAAPIVAAGIEHARGSDHWPIWIDVDLCR